MLNYVCMLYILHAQLYSFPIATYLIPTCTVYLVSYSYLPIDSLCHVFLAYYMAAVLIATCLSLRVYAYNVCPNYVS